MNDDWWNLLTLGCLAFVLHVGVQQGAEHNDFLNANRDSFDLDRSFDHEKGTVAMTQQDFVLVVGGIAAYAAFMAVDWLLSGLALLVALRLAWRSWKPKPAPAASAIQGRDA